MIANIGAVKGRREMVVTVLCWLAGVPSVVQRQPARTAVLQLRPGHTGVSLPPSLPPS